MICDDNGIPYKRHKPYSRPESDNNGGPASESAQMKLIHQQMKEKSEIFISQSTAYKEDFDKSLDEVLVCKDKLPDEWKKCYLGWDEEEKSIVIINQSSMTGQVWNIKHKKKRGFDGKWISYPKSQAFPFPVDYYKQHKDKKVILCEGEKDALNLLSIGGNCITLGGAATSWNRHKQILKDKDVYIWFDNDLAGYDNAIRRYDELRETAKTIHLVLFCGLEEKISDRYDISDFLKDHKVSNTETLFSSISKIIFADREEAVRVIDRKYKYRNIIEADVPRENEKTQSLPIPADKGENNFWKQSSALLMLTTILLAIALSINDHLQYEFYTLSRVVNASVFALVALFSYKGKDIGFTIIFGIMAFLFNPLHPFFLTREIWVVVDVIVLLIMWYYLIIRIKVFNRIFNRSIGSPDQPNRPEGHNPHAGTPEGDEERSGVNGKG